MASYHVIGGDTKEYGPIWADDVRTWITEGRLNGQSLAKAEGETAWRTLASFPEFADALKASTPTGATPPPFNRPAVPVSTDFSGRDYELDIGGCITRAWDLLKDNFGTLFLGFLVTGAIIFVASLLVNGIASLLLPAHNLVLREVIHLASSLALAPVVGPMLAGYYLMILRINRGQSTSVGEVFAGFHESFKNLFLGQMVVSLVIGLCMAPYAVINEAKLLPITEQMQHAAPQDVQALLPQMWSALFATLPVMLVCMIPLTYLTVNWQFMLPLIIDKRMAFWPAMKASWTMVHKHWWYVFGLTIVVGLVFVAGFLACCVGALFSVPLGMGAMMIAYETIFGERQK
jgi:hypothetical protein